MIKNNQNSGVVYLIDKTRKLELEAVNRPHGLVVVNAKADGKIMSVKPEGTSLSNLFFNIWKEHANGRAVPKLVVTISNIDAVIPLINLIQLYRDMNKIVIVRSGIPRVHAECKGLVNQKHLNIEVRKYMPKS